MKSRILIFVVLLGLAAIAIGWVYEARLKPEIRQAELIIPDNIDYFLTGLHYRAMNADGVLDYEFDSRRLEHHPRTDVSHIELPSLQIYRAGDRWRIDSRLGRFEHRQNRLHLEQDVVVEKFGEAPLRLLGERISFEPDRDLVSSDSRIVILTDESRIEAEQAVFNIADGIYSLRRAKAVYRDADQAG